MLPLCTSESVLLKCWNPALRRLEHCKDWQVFLWSPKNGQNMWICSPQVDSKGWQIEKETQEEYYRVNRDNFTEASLISPRAKAKYNQMLIPTSDFTTRRLEILARCQTDLKFSQPDVRGSMRRTRGRDVLRLDIKGRSMMKEEDAAEGALSINDGSVLLT
eukprot:6213494-Pleurochrysis_carterae.AAC.1